MKNNVLQIIVDKHGKGDYRTIGEAVQAAPYDVETAVLIHSGVYREKIFCDKRKITLSGIGPGETLLYWDDGARGQHADGRPNGTFRSYTLFLGGESAHVSNMTIVNEAGDGDMAGQAIAVYGDACHIWMDHVNLIGHQDTLFCAPLPEKERQPDGFLGPGMLAPRRLSRQYYHRCAITGDIDFIFGGADAVFDQCQIISRDRGQVVNGYIAAPSGERDGLGFVFRHCHLTSPAQAETVYLARPWRAQGRAAFLHCQLEGHIKPEGWHDWNDEVNQRTAYFAEFENVGPGAAGSRAEWAHALNAMEADGLNNRAERLIASVLEQWGE